MRPWMKLLPVFIVEWFARRHLEVIESNGVMKLRVRVPFKTVWIVDAKFTDE